MTSLIVMVLLCQTQNKQLLIYIDKQPPNNCAQSDWERAALCATEEWYGRLGYRVCITKNRREADIKFYTNQLGKYLGRTFPEPYQGLPCTVVIDTECPTVYHTLLHELGHTLGLKHRRNSIMQIESPRPQHLTPLDLQTIRELYDNRRSNP